MRFRGRACKRSYGVAPWCNLTKRMKTGTRSISQYPMTKDLSINQLTCKQGCKTPNERFGQR